MRRAPIPVVIAIPAKDEAGRIGACLESLAGQQNAPPFGVVVLANNCTDDTAAIAQGWAGRFAHLEVAQLALPPRRAHAGEARRLAMRRAMALCASDGVLLTTDADTCAPPHWVARNLAALMTGVQAVAGRAVIDPVEARQIPRHLHELDALECGYAALLDEIAWLLVPDPHDPWPRHDEHSGASIAVRHATYRAVGGIASMPTGEDRAFFAALRRAGAAVRHAPDVWVTVSGRLDGRAHGGMAETIRARIACPPEWLDDRLEPVADRVARLRGQAMPPPRRVAMAEVRRETAHAAAIRDALRRDRGIDQTAAWSARAIEPQPASRAAERAPIAAPVTAGAPGSHGWEPLRLGPGEYV